MLNRSKTVAGSVLNQLVKTGSISHRDAAFLADGVGSLTKEISRLRSLGYRIKTEKRVNKATGRKYTRWTLQA